MSNVVYRKSELARHGNTSNVERTKDGKEHQATRILVALGRIQLGIGFFAFCKAAFTAVVGAAGFPVRFGNVGKGQTAITIPTQASDSGGSGFLKFQAKGGEGLVGLVSALLGEEGLEFRFDRRLTLFGHGAEQVFALMGNTPWALRRGELEFNRIEHGLVAGGEPQVSLLKGCVA